ncbi:helix-turn-helix domain-containing protein [Arthrobacter sp. zg-Y826]|uniref:IclR family transcriptional regulator n=1 Tax=Arthrobacter jinronghuae TaxID=2964609 RepID=UPI00210248AF|nr:helix-turn-helix domain-containing protein [Arthrobacter jinronghuae]MCQ1957533.1 helix-turn-helix domain-containing protein [Arthrobacter jinronghuae]
MVNTEGDAETSGYDIQAVSRAAQICALFGPHTVEVTAAEVAARLDLNRTTAYRYCMALVAAGILERSPRRGAFILGGLMLQLGVHALSRRRVVQIAPPYLAELSGAVGMTAVLSLWAVGGPVAALVEEDRKQTVIVTVRPGSLLDIAAAQTQVFLAYLKDPHALGSTAAGLSAAQRTELDGAIYTARRQGYSIAHHPGGLFGVAVPVFDEYGIAATVALLGADRTGELGPGSPILARLMGTAAALSDELGGGQEGQADLR